MKMIVLTIVFTMVMMVLTSTSHISQKGFDCHLTGRNKGNKHFVGDKDNDVDDGVEDGVECVDDGNVENGVDNGDDDGDDDGYDNADKHLTHPSQGVDFHLTGRSKQKK
eukprot:10000384-Ditylum_brightwellii.AAC.1